MSTRASKCSDACRVAAFQQPEFAWRRWTSAAFCTGWKTCLNAGKTGTNEQNEKDHTVIPAEPGALACPDCGRLHADPRYRSFYSSGSLLYSDFHREVISMAIVRPQYVTCLACAHVNLLADFHEARHPGAFGIARWVAATLEEAFSALVQAQPPFTPGSGYAHNLRLHLWRSENCVIRHGVAVGDPQRRAQLLQSLVEECVSRVKIPVYQYLLGEIERQRGEFEVAAQRFRNLIEDERTDPLLVWHGRQNLEWCLAGRTLQQKLTAPQSKNSAPSTPESRTRVYKLVMAVSDSVIRQTISSWVNFPSGIMNVGDIKFLPLAAATSDPRRGVVVLESDLAKSWPGDSGPALFIQSLSSNDRTSPWLLLGDLELTQTRVTSLRKAGFHATSMDPIRLSRARFEDWALYGQRRAEHQWRRVQKFA